MQWDISSLTSNGWFNFSSYSLNILSFIGMIYVYYKSKKEKRPLYSMKSTHLLENLSEKIESLQVTYKETKIKNLTVTHISFWNSGNDTIRKSDIAEHDVLNIKTKNNVQILDVKTIPPKTKNNFDFRISEDLLSFTFTFDFIERNQGVIFQIMHTGKSNDDLKLIGTIIGFGEPLFISWSTFANRQDYLSSSKLKSISKGKYSKILTDGQILTFNRIMNDLNNGLTPFAYFSFGAIFLLNLNEFYFPLVPVKGGRL